MSEIRNYADMIKRSFGIGGVMTFAWYTLSTHRCILEKLGLRPPHLILYGPPGCGKTELATAIAATDVPEGLRPQKAFHQLPDMTVGKIRALIDGAAAFSVLEDLREDAPQEIIRQFRYVELFSPLLLLTSIFPPNWQLLYDSYIAIELPYRSFTQSDRQNLEILKGAEWLAYMFKQYLYKDPVDFPDKFKLHQEKILDCIREETTFEIDGICNKLVRYYATIIGHWEAMSFSEERELEELSEFAMESIINRLSLIEEWKRRKTLMKRTVDNDGRVTLTWFMSDSRQIMVFDDETTFKGFVHALRMMESMQAESVEVNI